MAKKKKKRKLKPRTIWSLFIAYFLAGIIVAILYLNHNAPDPDTANAAQQGATSAWGLFPILVMLWPVFLVILLIQYFT